MKRFILTALLAALLLVPATALAKRGHKVHRHHGQVGTITSFDSATGELVITTTKGRTLSALVTDDTHIQCNNDDEDDDANDDSTARASRHGDDNDEADDERGDDGDDADDNDDADDDHGHHGHHGHHSSKCSTDDLTAGTTVRRARIDIDEDDDAVWKKLKLA